MLFRLILWGLIFYLGYKLVKSWLEPNDRQPKVKGKPQNDPLDLRDADIEDANFREIDDK